MPTARGLNDLAGVVESKLYVAGGAWGLTVLEYYDPNTNSWISGPPMVFDIC